MDFSSICRTCIRTFNKSGLNPIFLAEGTHERFSSAFYSCTGVQVKLNDGLPQRMCTACMSQFNSTLKFRKQCKQAERQLLKAKAEIGSKNSVIGEEQHSIGSNIQSTLKNKLDMRNISDDTAIKSELIIKDEPWDIEDNKSLKYFIKRKKDKTKTEYTSDADFFNHEERTHNKNSFKTEERSPQNDDYIKYGTDSEENYDLEQKTEFKLEISETNFTQDKTVDIPYIITDTETCTKKMRVVCKLCQKELSIRSIDSHMMRRHPGADQRKVKCELCDKYVMREKLNRHRIMMHGSVGVKCGYCKIEFKNKATLVSHVSTCSAKNKRKTNDSGRAIAECDICHMTMQRASLTKHKAVKHAGQRPVCEHCGKSFGNKFRLNEHCRAKHGYEKFKCSYCDFRSAGIMAMRNHERRHRGEKPFVCESCGAKFHAAYLLLQHRHSHNTEKLFKCDLCPASFKANNNLHMHKLTCHSKSYYSCTLCARSYKCRYYAVKHVRLSHHDCDATEVIKVIGP